MLDAAVSVKSGSRRLVTHLAQRLKAWGCAPERDLRGTVITSQPGEVESGSCKIHI